MGQISKQLAIDPQGLGRRLRFWIHQPHFERGVWRDSCSYKTQETCKVLKAINGSGLVLQASFVVLEAGLVTRAHCHTTNREVFVDVALLIPGSGLVSTSAGGKLQSWEAGEVRVLDGSFEHAETNEASAGEAAVFLRLVV